MNRLTLSLAAASLALPASPIAAQTAPDLVKVALDTSAGRIVVALDRTRAPITTANFLHYVDSGRFNGIGFYRAMKSGSGGLIQAGITDDARKLFPAIAHEPTGAAVDRIQIDLEASFHLAAESHALIIGRFGDAFFRDLRR